MALFKKVLKKSGQLELVKLLPMLVSKGLGRGEFVTELANVMEVGVEETEGEGLAATELTNEMMVMDGCVGAEVD